MSAHLGLRSYPWEMLKCGESLKKKKRKRGEFPSESPTSIREDELCCCLHGGNSQTAAGVQGAVSCRAKAESCAPVPSEAPDCFCLVFSSHLSYLFGLILTSYARAQGEIIEFPHWGRGIPCGPP